MRTALSGLGTLVALNLAVLTLAPGVASARELTARQAAMLVKQRLRDEYKLADGVKIIVRTKARATPESGNARSYQALLVSRGVQTDGPWPAGKPDRNRPFMTVVGTVQLEAVGQRARRRPRGAALQRLAAQLVAIDTGSGKR